MNDTVQSYLSCRVGREWYGIELAHISKVLHLVALTELPDAPPDVLGLLTLQQQVVPVVDLRRRFKVPDVTLRTDTPVVVVDAPQGSMGFVVDDADDVEVVHPDQITTYEGADLPYVTGVVKRPDHLLLILDMAQLVSKQTAGRRC